MQDKINEIERLLLDTLQSDVTILIGNKVYRDGKLKNFKVFDLYLQLSLVIDDKDRKVELPLPFAVREVDGDIIFSYRLDDMGTYGETLERKIKKYLGTPKNKLYNKVLTIKRSE